MKNEVTTRQQEERKMTIAPSISPAPEAPKLKDMDRFTVHGRLYLYDATRKREHLRWVGFFRDEESRERYAKQILEGRARKAQRHQERVDRKREARKALALDNPFKVGTVLQFSWGYDQTNQEYAKVIGTTKGTVTIQRMRKVFLEQRGPAGNQVAPDMLWEGGKVERITIQISGYSNKPYLPSFLGHSWSPWDGKADYETDSMFGH
jgi:hypothetical protein